MRIKSASGKANLTLIFTILVVALAVYVYFFEFKKGQKEEEKKELDAKVFSGFELEKVRKVLISPNPVAKEFDIKIEKSEGSWRVLTPVNDVGDKDAIETFITSLLEEKTEESIAPDQVGDLKTYGLDLPKGSITLSSDKTTLVNVGSVKTYDGRFYASTESKPGIQIVSSVWGAYTEKKPNDFRNKKVERSRFNDWNEFSTSVSGSPRLHLKKVDGEWQAVPKSEIPLQHNLVEGFIFQMVNLEILDFVSETKTDLAKYSLSKPEIDLKFLGEKDKKAHDFSLSLSKKSPDAKPEHASATSSELSGVVEVYSSILDVAKRGTSYFYNRKFPFQYDSTKAARVRIHLPELKFLAEKRDGKWVKVESNLKMEISPKQVEELTQALARTQAESYLDEKAKGLAPAKYEIEVYDDKGASLLKFTWGDEYKPKVVDPANAGLKFYYAQTSLAPKQVLAIKQSAIEELSLSSLFIEAKKPSPSPTKEAQP